MSYFLLLETNSLLSRHICRLLVINENHLHIAGLGVCSVSVLMY